MRCLSKRRRGLIKKAAFLPLHFGYWSLVSGLVISNFLYYGILQKKVRNDHLGT